MNFWEEQIKPFNYFIFVTDIPKPSMNIELRGGEISGGNIKPTATTDMEAI